jgi:Fis family transcriptional regulator
MCAEGRVNPAPANPDHAAQSFDGTNDPLHVSVVRCLDTYFHSLDGASATGLFDLVMDEVERPLLERVMAEVDGNQTRAAAVLGLNRGTLRKKLKHHGLID